MRDENARYANYNRLEAAQHFLPEMSRLFIRKIARKTSYNFKSPKALYLTESEANLDKL